jgi:5-methylcytosine-specific restriction endonuclease McrA
MSNYVFVLDTLKKPLTPCQPSMARKLLNANKAAVFRWYPFTIILKKEVDANHEPLELKLDPGSKVTGIALKKDNKIVFGAELVHRGLAIKSRLDSRRAIRRSRRNRKTRYRQARFVNRTRSKGWLAPSLQHRVETILTWVNRFRKLAPIGSISQELVRFDLQQMENPEISGIEYQQGELQGYEIREYLLNKWERKCAYCRAENVPLQVEHIKPKAKGGSNRISNLCLACEKCNQKKGTQNIVQFLAKKPEVLQRILSQAKRPLKDAAAVNSTRWALFNRLKETGLPVSTGSGGLTKFNRVRLSLPKSHWLDAACVGKVDSLEILTTQPLSITAKGWGCRLMVQNDKYGFPRKNYRAKQKVKEWKTGDIVSVIRGKFAPITGKRIKTVRFKGNFDIRLDTSTVISVSRNHLKAIHRQDGYDYAFV